MSISMFQDVDIEAMLDDLERSDQDSDDEKVVQSTKALQRKRTNRRGPKVGAQKEIIPEEDEDQNEESWNIKKSDRSSKKPKPKKPAMIKEPNLSKKATEEQKPGNLDYFLPNEKSKPNNSTNAGKFVCNSDDNDEDYKDDLIDHHMNGMMEENSYDDEANWAEESDDDGML